MEQSNTVFSVETEFFGNKKYYKTLDKTHDFGGVCCSDSFYVVNFETDVTRTGSMQQMGCWDVDEHRYNMAV